MRSLNREHSASLPYSWQDVQAQEAEMESHIDQLRDLARKHLAELEVPLPLVSER